jgi:hypothetical protein
MSEPTEPKRKPRPNPKPYDRPPRPPKNTEPTYKSSAKPVATTHRSNLALGDWLQVFKYIDEHPGIKQTDVVKHFSTLKTGALEFKQSALSKKLQKRHEMEARATANPTALSSKRPRVVTRPDVERAVLLWFRSMQEHGETVSGLMLSEKRTRFEKLLEVPDEERLGGSMGWVASFCRTYQIKEYRRHGEAGSVDLEGVEAERRRLAPILAKYAKKDQFNADETGLFAYASPDRTLSTHAMSGKKQDKFRITLLFTANADGSEKLPIFFIGKSKQPRAFKKKTPLQRGFHYRNNKKAWMNAELFEEWLKSIDQAMRRDNRHIILLLDNFSGHSVVYEPTNIRVEFFEPNMTSFIQPLDAGIIRCFKAYYRRAVCLRALNRDEAGEADIWKINILEAMMISKQAWNNVSAETIEHCWDHTKIHGKTTLPATSVSQPSLAEKGWDIVRQFATTDMSLPEAEQSLQALYRESYDDVIWRPALNAVMVAENDSDVALASIEPLAGVSATASVLPIALVQSSQLKDAEKELTASLLELKNRNRIFGPVPTAAQFIDLPDENQIGESPYRFDSDESIVSAAQHQLGVESGEIVEEEGPDADCDDEEEISMTNTEALEMCRKLGQFCLEKMDSEAALDLSQKLRDLQIILNKDIEAGKVQVNLDSFWAPQTAVETDVAMVL